MHGCNEHDGRWIHRREGDKMKMTQSVIWMEHLRRRKPGQRAFFFIGIFGLEIPSQLVSPLGGPKNAALCKITKSRMSPKARPLHAYQSLFSSVTQTLGYLSPWAPPPSLLHFLWFIKLSVLQLLGLLCLMELYAVIDVAKDRTNTILIRRVQL